MVLAELGPGPGTAAVALPIVVGVIALIGLLAWLARRNGHRRDRP